jgi:hypothetical protein
MRPVFRFWPQVLLAAVAAVFAFAGLAASAQAATITNSTQWLETLAVMGETDNAGNQARMTFVVEHPRGRTVTGIQVDDDWNGTNNLTATSPLLGTTQQPAGGFDYSRVSLTKALNTGNTGLSDCTLGIGGTNRTTRAIFARAKLDDGTFTAAVSQNMVLLRADSNACDDRAYLYGWTVPAGPASRTRACPSGSRATTATPA